MRPTWGRLLRHVALTGISLAVIGYLLGRAFLFAQRVYGGGAVDPANDRVLWQTPVAMAGLGMGLTAGVDLLMMFLRRPLPVPATDTPSNA